MKVIYLIVSVFFMLFLSSCIRDEALNAEADIEGVDSVWVDKAIRDGILKGRPRVENNKVIFMVRKGVDLATHDFAPIFYLTPGATISPANGTERNFVTPQIYTVTSQSGEWRKPYEVSFEYAEVVTKYDFEHWEYNESNQYYRFYEVAPNGQKQYIWASGNPGFALTGMAKTPEEYPTVSYTPGMGGKGKCVKLETMNTGEFGQKVGMVIASGNLFIGEFSVSNAVLSPLKATKFGLQILDAKPLYLRGYYKYKAGPVYTDEKKNPVEWKRDECDIYAVLYKVDPAKFKALNGADVLTSERIVALARIKDAGEPSEWTYFDLPFMGRDANGEFTNPVYEFDGELLEQDGYAISIVFSSSIDGAYFKGAIGSTLYVDEVELVCQDND